MLIDNNLPPASFNEAPEDIGYQIPHFDVDISNLDFPGDFHQLGFSLSKRVDR